jgi:hypothetical protein
MVVPRADLLNFVEGPHALAPSRNVAECLVGFRTHCAHTGWGKVRSLVSSCAVLLSAQLPEPLWR